MRLDVGPDALMLAGALKKKPPNSLAAAPDSDNVRQEKVTPVAQ